MDSPPALTVPPFSVLLALKWRILRNRLNQILDESPVRVLVTVVFIAIIWLSLYLLFRRVFVFLGRTPESVGVAVPYVFHIFFVAMTVLLGFSNTVLCYGALFSRDEPTFLLSGPTPPAHIVGMVYLESLFYSSWALILLGFPLMMAIGSAQDLPWYFFVIFIGSFLAFVPIPGALGLLAAWAVARWMPRSARRVLAAGIAAALVGGLTWWVELWGLWSRTEASDWLDAFMNQLSVLRSALLPPTWPAHAINYARTLHPDDASFYLYVTIAHAMLFSWIAVAVVGRSLQPAFARVRSMGGERLGTFGAPVSDWITRVLFFHTRPQVRMLILKDFRSFVRDPTQWSQLAILFGLLSLYLFYLPKYRVYGFHPQMKALVCFLNYSAITLIISTFTSRFVFPMISLEGRQIWLVGLWPLARGSVMWAKFQFALAVTVFATLVVTLLSIRAIELPPTVGLSLIVSTIAVCFGLCGFSIGLGARLPNYRERSAARVSSGLGGTVNLVASMGLVMCSMALTGYLCWRLLVQARLSDSETIRGMDAVGLLITAGQVVLGVGSGLLAMRIGVRHFTREEF